MHTDDALRGRYVQFRVRDVHIPEPVAILHQLHDAELLTGRVIDLSHDAHAAGAAFAVVDVRRLRRRCIVSVGRLLPANNEPVTP